MKKLLLYLLGLVGLAPETKLNLNSPISADGKIRVDRPGEGIYLPPLCDVKVKGDKLVFTARKYKALEKASEPVLVADLPDREPYELVGHLKQTLGTPVPFTVMVDGEPIVPESHKILPKKELPLAPIPRRQIVPPIEPLGGLTSLDELQPGDKVARRTSNNAFRALVYKVEGWIDENTLLLRRPKGNLVFEYSVR